MGGFWGGGCLEAAADEVDHLVLELQGEAPKEGGQAVGVWLLIGGDGDLLDLVPIGLDLDATSLTEGDVAPQALGLDAEVVLLQGRQTW